MRKDYYFAGMEIAVDIPDPWMYTDERLLQPFRIGQAKHPHMFRFAVVKTLTPPEGVCTAVMPDYAVYEQNGAQTRYIGISNRDWTYAQMRAEHRGKDHFVELRAERYGNGTSAKTVLNAMAVEHLAVQANAFVLHAAYIEWRGKAILFTAPSGTGKSTQAELWRTLRGAEIINGDRAAVRCADPEIAACGIPFAGSSKDCRNRTLPLAAVVYLTQAPQTTIRKMRGYEAFSRIWEGVSVNIWDKQDMEKASALVKQVAEQIPVFHLSCTPDASAVRALEQALREQVSP